MSRRRNQRKEKPFGQGKHRKARVQRFMAKHPDFIKRLHEKFGNVKKD